MDLLDVDRLGRRHAWPLPSTPAWPPACERMREAFPLDMRSEPPVAQVLRRPARA